MSGEAESDGITQTHEAAAMDTEGEMKSAAAELREEAGLPPVAAKASGDGDDGEAAAGGETEMVPPEVDAALQQQLQDMGFSTNKAIRHALQGPSPARQVVQLLVIEQQCEKNPDIVRSSTLHLPVFSHGA